MRKVLKPVLLIILFLIIVNVANITYASNDTITINFDDEKLYNIMVQNLEGKIKYKNDYKYVIDISKNDMNEITKIVLEPDETNENEVLDIHGIEKFTNIQKIEINKFKLEDLSVLKLLPNLTALRLTNCQITDIQDLKELVKLTDLDLSHNQITDISALSSLVNLNKLRVSNNDIDNIAALKDLNKLAGLDLSNNRISNITPLSTLKNLTEPKKTYDIEGVLPIYLMKLINFEFLYLNNNQISDISSLSEDVLKSTSLNEQRIYINTNKKEVKIPKVCKQYKNTDKLEFTNCSLNETSSKVVIQDKNKDTNIKINDGIFEDSIIIIGYDTKAPTLMAKYDDRETTSQTVTITADEEIMPIEGWTLSENKIKLSKIYTKNTTEKIKVYDKVGNKSKITIEVKNINKQVVNTSKSVTKNVAVSKDVEIDLKGLDAVSKGMEIVKEADKYVGKTPYVLQGDSLEDGIDCSHFVYRILKMCGVYSGKYLRSTDWIKVGEPVEDLEHAIAGDIIVWDGHVAIYDGNGMIVEAKGTKWGLTHDRDAAKAIDKETFLGIRRFTGYKNIET